MKLIDRIKMWLFFKMLNISVAILSDEFRSLTKEIEGDLDKRANAKLGEGQ